jgi:DNA-binding CsgD family transcriptional regulator/tetratricopeptide (TPR) repeat protein
MERPFNDSGNTKGTPSTAVFAPSSVSDILYLINSYRSTEMDPQILQTLDRARIQFVRGDVETALASVDEALEGLDPAEPAYRDVIAFRLLVVTMLGGAAEPRTGEPGARLADGHGGPDAHRVVSLCVDSDEHWHSGNLTQGLWLNRSAVEQAHGVAPIWRVYAALLLVKKLSDIHIPLQANRVIRELEALIESSGLHVFGSLPKALRSVLLVQAGQFDEAIECAAAAVQVSEETKSAIGVKLALSAAATAHVARREWDRAAAALESFHRRTRCYVLPDSVARAAVVNLALVAEREGPRAAADRLRANWGLLSTGSACSVEDPLRPAWLVSVALRGGDRDLAMRCLAAIEELAAGNGGFTLLEHSVESARCVMAGGRPQLSPILDFGGDRRRTAVRADTPAVVPEPSAPLSGERPPASQEPAGREPTAEAGTVGQEHADGPEKGDATAPGEPSPISLLSLRETEIARLVGRGMTNQQVANQLGVSPHTVNFHLRNIFRKLSISTRVKLGPLMAGTDR